MGSLFWVGLVLIIWSAFWFIVKVYRHSRAKHLIQRDSEYARQYIAQFKEIMKQRKGVVRPMTPVLLMALTLPSIMTGFALGYYARSVKQIKIEALKQQERAKSIEVYNWFKVLEVYDKWTFKVQFVDGGEPFELKFIHDGSELKLGWDVGMVIEYVKFVKTPDGLSVADDDMGMHVFRNGGKNFVDYRSTEWTMLRQLAQ